MIRAVVFDVDGTLVDSNEYHVMSWIEAFKDYGHSVSADRIREQIGKGGDQLIPVFLTPEKYDRYGEELDRHRSDLFQREYLSRVEPFPKVRELMERIRADGKRIALASSGKPPEIDRYKTAAGIKELVEEQTSTEDADKSKPAPDIFAAALRKLGDPPPGEVLVVGDSPYDARAASKLGIRTVGLLCGGFLESVLRKAGCIAVYRDPADLLAHYGESPLARGWTASASQSN